MAPAKAACLYLPEELWNCIIKILNDDNHRYLEPLSVVSKQFLSITNCLQFSVTVTDQAVPFIPRLFQRFPNLTSLNVTISSKRKECDFNALLIEISTFPLSNIKSLHLSNLNSKIPKLGLQALSKKMKNLTSLTCSKILGIGRKHLLLIAYSFPLLEELNLSFPIFSISRKYEFALGNVHQVLPLPKLQQINLSGDLMDRIYGFYYLRKIYERLGGGGRIDIDLVWDCCL
ncbi:F-box/LRR-repeat protein [Trifolium repens]|nr:F-box/LRR-repeat protein [Trifolium repens]